MNLPAAVHDFRDATRAFSRPARRYLLTEFLAWAGYGVFQVLFNLLLVEAGFPESFVGRAVSVNGLGLAVAALPAGWIAERWGRRRCLLAGAALLAVGLLARAVFLEPWVILSAGFLAGVGHAGLQIAGAPFLTEHSTPRERTHLFTSFFASALLAMVLGNALGGVLPNVLMALAPGALDLVTAYRLALGFGGLVALAGVVPLAALGRLPEARMGTHGAPITAEVRRRMVAIALNFMLLGVGAGLVIPFMNLYFKNRHHCSSLQIGLFFSIGQVFTALASLAGPALARRFGKLRTAVTSELLSLPFLVTLGVETGLPLAVGAFWLRAVFMQAATPLIQAFVMEALPSELRARSTSLNNLVWNIGWSASATLAGTMIERAGYEATFFCTAALYLTAAVSFYLAFRDQPETAREVPLSEEAKGLRGDGLPAD